MRPFSRIMTTITAQFDEMISQIENHEAVAEASLRNLREDIRNAKVHYKMVQKDLQQTHSKIQQSEQEIQTWTDRAKKYGESDREKALHCVRRIQQQQEEITILKQKEQDLEKSSEQLKRQLLKVENQYQLLRARIQSMSCRDHAANLKSTVQDQPMDNMEDVFTRWEKAITKKEVAGEILEETIDEIALAMEAEEESQDLEMALDELLKKEKQ